MEIPAKTYNEKFESFLKILESDDRFDNVCKNFLESICSALYVNAATVTVSGYENSEPLSYELIADTHKYTVFAFDKEFNRNRYNAMKKALMQTGIHVADKAHPNGDNEEITLRGAVFLVHSLVLSRTQISMLHISIFCPLILREYGHLRRYS